MANKIELEIPTQEELQAKMAADLAANEEAERLRVARANRLAERQKPEPGDRFYVTTAIKPGRSRAGCMFSPDKRTEVRVAQIGETLGPVKEGDKLMHYVVSVDAAETILADSALSISITTASEVDVAALRRDLALKDEEIGRLQAENARILREARMAAKDSGDGSPSRLIAARKAGRGLPGETGFGGGKE